MTSAGNFLYTTTMPTSGRPATSFTAVPVDPLLVVKIKAAAAKAKESTEELNALIVEARLAGNSLREVADLAGVSHTQVNNLVRAALAKDTKD